MCRNHTAPTADALGDDERFFTNDGFNQAAGEAALERLLSLGDERPTAIFAASDILAVGAMLKAQRSGLRVPEDLAIIGFDDIEVSSYMAISTMQQPMFEMGRLAVERILEKIENSDSVTRQILLATDLVARKSTLGAPQNVAKAV